ncbi:winged helix-turn-helix domain-containing protein [Nonomuraea sp. NPDC046570]|uniref:winged helix-turn-helix domain-containing protein n=1 Tax=Nonomuraea sp. NPDC046570 TaxID=3155255 RepID=UPI0033FA4815
MIELRADQPKWRQVAGILRQRIESGEYRPGVPLPSETAIGQEFGIARGTARKIIAALREEGLIYTVPQIGSFVGSGPEDA